MVDEGSIRRELDDLKEDTREVTGLVRSLEAKVSNQQVTIQSTIVELRHIQEHLQGIQTSINRVGWFIVLAVLGAIVANVVR